MSALPPASGGPFGAPLRRCVRAAAPAAIALALLAPAPPPARAGADVVAEALLRQPVSAERSRGLATWLRTAPLAAELRLLRYGPDVLGPDERPLVEAALRQAPKAEPDLRRRLEARRELALAGEGRRTKADPADLRALRPRQSVWRVGVLLPDSGDYAGFAATVEAAVVAGLAWDPAAGPFLVEHHGTGDAEPARAAAALDTAVTACGVVVGELLSEPTFALAAGTRIAGVPLVSPTATDESIGHAGPAVFQVGPPNALRGERLARTFLAPGRKVAIITSSARGHAPLVEAFAAAAESLGATIVRRDVYAPGVTDFRSFSRGLRTFGAEVLFWDGDSREVVPLLRQLGSDGISVRVCGGAALSPDQFHTGEKLLLEGVSFVADDWQLAPAQQAAVDSLAEARGERPGSLWTRGFLAGRRIAAAVAEGARTPAELAARLVSRDPSLRAGGFLDATREGASIPVFTVQHGEAVPLPGSP